MTRNQLQKLAADMRRELAAAHTGYVERIVHGAWVALYRRDERLQLYIGRNDAPPTYDSVAPLAEAFAIAADTQPELVALRRGDRLGQSVPLNCLRFSWTESELT